MQVRFRFGLDPNRSDLSARARRALVVRSPRRVASRSVRHRVSTTPCRRSAVACMLAPSAVCAGLSHRPYSSNRRRPISDPAHASSSSSSSHIVVVVAHRRRAYTFLPLLYVSKKTLIELGVVACGAGRSRRDVSVQVPSPIYPLEGPGFAHRCCSCRMVGCRSSARPSSSGAESRSKIQGAGGTTPRTRRRALPTKGMGVGAARAPPKTGQSEALPSPPPSLRLSGRSPPPPRHPPSGGAPFRLRASVRPRWEAVDPRRRATLDTRKDLVDEGRQVPAG
jgi:hypothetical protein